MRSSFNEDLYTKKLDLGSMTKEQIARADRIAKEIEGSSSRYSPLMNEALMDMGWMDGCMDGWMDRSIYGWIVAWMDRSIYGWMVAWIAEYIE